VVVKQSIVGGLFGIIRSLTVPFEEALAVASPSLTVQVTL